MSQKQNEMIQMFSSHLEETYCSCFLILIPKGDMDNQLKNWLFYGMHRTLQDSILYLLDDNTISYNQLMVAAKKAEGEATEGKGVTQVKTKAAPIDENSSKLNNMKKQLAVGKSMVSKNVNLVRQKKGLKVETIKGM